MIMSRPAFTMIEILVAVLLTSMVLLISHGVLISTLDVHQTVRVAGDDAQRRNTCFDLMGVDLEGAILSTPASEIPGDCSWLVETDQGRLRALEFPTSRSLLSFTELAEMGPLRVRYEFSRSDGQEHEQALTRLAYAQGRILPARMIGVLVGRVDLEVSTRSGWSPVRSPTILQAAPPAIRLTLRDPDNSRVLARRTFVVGGDSP